MTGERTSGRKAAWILGIAACVLLLGAGVYMVRNLVNSKAAPPRQVAQEVQIIRPPPPPPDQPPPPPPPPEEKVDISDPVPEEPTPSDQPPPGEQLGVDAAGSGSGDGFGLVGRPGGRDLLASGGSAYAWYAGVIKNEILGHLGEEKKVRTGSYSVVVRLWLRRDGTIEKTILASSTGDKERDRAIEVALSQMARVSQPPPADMPQPISLRIVSRG